MNLEHISIFSIEGIGLKYWEGIDMNQDKIRKYQLSQLELLRETDRICRELNISYYLIGGTLLGAIRHRGFIPWDADIDIAMRRKDYEIFRKYWLSHGNDDYFYEHYLTDPNHWGPHAILRKKGTHIKYKRRENEKYQPMYDGIYLDIFPLDEAPKQKWIQVVQARLIRIMYQVSEQKVARVYEDNISALKLARKKIVQLLLSPITFRTLGKLRDWVMQWGNNHGDGHLVSMASHYSYRKQYMLDEVYGVPVEVDFEGEKRLAPAQTHTYLSQLFGDYMKLPPEDKRYSELNNIIDVDYSE